MVAAIFPQVYYLMLILFITAVLIITSVSVASILIIYRITASKTKLENEIDRLRRERETYLRNKS